MPGVTNYVSYRNTCCGEEHTWWYVGDIPVEGQNCFFEGRPCQCGAMIGHYDVCPVCKHFVFVHIPREEYEKSQEDDTTMVWDKNLSRYVDLNKEQGGLIS